MPGFQDTTALQTLRTVEISGVLTLLLGVIYTLAVNGEYVRLNFSRTGLLAFIVLLAGTTPVGSQTSQDGIKKQKNLPRHSIQEIVRRNLSEDVDEEDAARNLFLLGDEAVPSLVKFLSDPDRGIRAGAARGLAYIGNQEGMQAIRNAVEAEQDKATKSAMSCFLAGALVQTKLEKDLDFLKSSAERAPSLADDDETDLTAMYAALALGMRGGDDSLPALRNVAKVDDIAVEEVGKAIRWIESKSTPRQPTTGASLSDEDLIKKTVLDNTFFAEGERNETSVEQLTFNPSRDKALVSLEIYHGPKSARGYDLVLAKERGVWRVQGIWFAWVA
jgi:hypothetical protein